VAVDATGLAQGVVPHVLLAAPASSCAKAIVAAALIDMSDRNRSVSAVRFVIGGATKPLERLRKSVSSRPGGFRTFAHRVGAGRRSIQQQGSLQIFEGETANAERYARQMRKENVGHRGGARRDPLDVSTTALLPGTD